MVRIAMRRAVVLCLAALAPALDVGERVACGREWLTGSRLAQRLEAPVSIYWSGAPLRDALARLSTAERLAIFLDRRVDPGHALHLSVDGAPLRSALEQLAGELSLGVTFLGPVAYLGPHQATDRLGALSQQCRDDVRRLARERQKNFRRLEAWQWGELSTPRELVLELGRRADVQFVELQRIPHDLWPAAELPPLTWTDRLTLVLNGFDLTFRIHSEGNAVELIPVGNSVPWVRRLRPPDSRRVPTAAPSSARRTYTLTVQNKTVDALLGELGRRLELRFDVDREALRNAGVSLDTLVSLQVRDATLDELLEHILRPAGLSFERYGNAVRVGTGENR